MIHPQPLTAELGESARQENPFSTRERAAGAVHDVRFGVMLPEHFGDPRAEYEAARRRSGLVDLSFRGLLEVRGEERARWLNGQVTHDLAALQPGQVQRAAVLEVKGHVLTDVAVYAREEAFWLDLPRDRAVAIQAALDRRIIADDVVVSNLTPDTARLMLVGPAAAAVMEEAAGTAIAGLPPWRHGRAALAGVKTSIAATRWLGVAGFDVTVPLEGAERAWDLLLLHGSRHGLRPIGMRALEWLRVEAGWPWYGQDLDEGCLLMEALTTDYVSFTKGCYTGQEVVIRIEHQGHVNRKLTGLLIAGDVVPPPGAAVHAGDRTIGKVTSAVRSPGLDRIVALAYVRKEHLAPGTSLRVAAESGPLEAEVTALPFISGQ
jgi:folate-binding protein YgfZ